MAHLIGGIGSSHAPSIAFAFDAGHRDRAEWSLFFDRYVPVKRWLAEARPNVLVAVYNDHLNNFQLDTYLTFALGLTDRFAVADEGRGARPFSPVPGHPGFADHLARALVGEEFDLTLCQEMVLEHGIMSELPLLADPPWPFAVALAVNVIVEPLPSPRCCWRLGEAVGHAIADLPQDLRVAVMATGGLSHQLHGTSFGFVNPELDNRFLDLLERDPQRFAAASHADFTQRGGAESVEMMVWLAMRGELGQSAFRQLQRHYHAPLLTGYGLLALATTEQADAA